MNSYSSVKIVTPCEEYEPIDPLYNFRMYQLDEETRKSFPKFASLVDGISMFLAGNPQVVDALIKYTGFTKEKIFEIVQPGKGPKITLATNDDPNIRYGDGYFSASISPDNLFLSRQNVSNWENNLFIGNTAKYKNALAFSLLATILHETVHYGRFINDLNDPRSNNDYGTAFEELGFGFNVRYDVNQRVYYKLYMIP